MDKPLIFKNYKFLTFKTKIFCPNLKIYAKTLKFIKYLKIYAKTLKIYANILKFILKP